MSHSSSDPYTKRPGSGQTRKATTLFDPFGEFLAWFCFVAGTGLTLVIMIDILTGSDR